MRRPGLSKSNERKLAVARKLLGQVSMDMPDSVHTLDLAVQVAKAHDHAKRALDLLTDLAARRYYGVNFYNAVGDLVASYSTEGVGLTPEAVIQRAHEYRATGDRNVSPSVLAVASLEVNEHPFGFSGRKKVQIFPAKPVHKKKEAKVYA
jgi:hypothetical protein